GQRGRSADGTLQGNDPRRARGQHQRLRAVDGAGEGQAGAGGSGAAVGGIHREAGGQRGRATDQHGAAGGGEVAAEGGGSGVALRPRGPDRPQAQGAARGAEAGQRGRSAGGTLQGDGARRAGGQDQRLRAVHRAGEGDIGAGGDGVAVGGIDA